MRDFLDEISDAKIEALKEERKPNYRLVIHTDSYTGNFERELIGFVLGIQSQEDDDYASSYMKAFWNKEAGGNVNSYEDYKKLINKESKISSPLESLLNDNKDLKDSNSELFESLSMLKNSFRSKNKFEDLYENYLDRTYQEVDDWAEDTFYNIEPYYKNPTSCDSIFIQLTKPLDDEYEKMIVNRIKNFFDYDIYQKISDYEWICQFGTPNVTNNHMKLLDLELIDKDNNLVKKYV